ncbi:MULTISPECIES: hypothetical protein [Achromobacter]|uniref:hypothetical protein n=1 Tax=Achromobacter TaxID=222 RepID=UPI0001F4335B|nr:hypothetical protein [Achromobacter xylosoxidans]AHC49853.1 hypothetical protein AX27061_5398 [Achromobacter xylosoxidans NBRC 15126 = ATCC 27061]EFV85860.1 hypothetical protein HMPREF0005_01438 [Achromobacter xylosoxidans C54]CCH06881.1 ortholog of Bordetella pertussis (BX470248) BP0189 [Achromobacter xylosoxidans NH44784-1996]KMJ90759.1 hypothetical protein ACH58_10235 [Achromobacter xylosoxidans]MBK1982341.1 hypothetical protein [Achromobacter xylosoxidans]
MFGFLKINQDAKRDEVQQEFVARVAHAAQDFVQAAGPDGAGLDYSLSSVHALDDALEAAHLGTLPLTPMQTVGAAAYLYEVARRAHGGLYEVCDDEDPVVLVCGSPETEVCFGAIAKVERRIRYGAAEAIPPYFDRFLAALDAGAATTIR